MSIILVQLPFHCLVIVRPLKPLQQYYLQILCRYYVGTMRNSYVISFQPFIVEESSIPNLYKPPVQVICPAMRIIYIKLSFVTKCQKDFLNVDSFTAAFDPFRMTSAVCLIFPPGSSSFPTNGLSECIICSNSRSMAPRALYYKN